MGCPPGRGRRSLYRLPGSPVTRRSGLARPHGADFALALADDFGQDRQPSRWLPSEAEKKCSTREFLGRRRDLSLRATPSFRDRGAVALRTGLGGLYTQKLIYNIYILRIYILYIILLSLRQ